MTKSKMAVLLAVFFAIIPALVFAQEENHLSSVEEALDIAQNQMNNAATDEGSFPQPIIDSSNQSGVTAESVQAPVDTTQPDLQNSVQGESEAAPAQQAQPAVEGESAAAETPPVKNATSIILDVLELKDMDIGDVLKLVSKKSGLNIVSGQDVRGKVTIYLKNVDVRDALRIILESNGLAYFEDGGIIRVMPAKEYELTYGHKFGEKTKVKIVQLKYANAADAVNLLTQIKSIIGKVIADEKSNTLVLMDIPDKLEEMASLVHEIDVPIATKVFDLSYAKAEDVSAKVSEALTKNVGTVKFDKRSNKVIVTDTPQKVKDIEQMIGEFDEKHEEVLIEAKIIQIILSDQYKMGVDWEAIVSNYHGLDLDNSFGILNSTDKKGRLSIGTISTDDYTALVEALDTVGKTNILSSPHITAVNNEEAKILVGSTEPYVTSTTTTPSSGPTTTAESVNFIDVGVKLFVTPTIHNDKNITMKIKPEVSSVTRFVTTGNNNRIPVVETSQAETTVLVKDNVTIVIGGLIKDEKISSINKIPLLGDLPLFGFAFRNTDSFLRKTELVIFLTPKIISGDVPEDKKLKTLTNKLKKK